MTEVGSMVCGSKFAPLPGRSGMRLAARVVKLSARSWRTRRTAT